MSALLHDFSTSPLSNKGEAPKFLLPKQLISQDKILRAHLKAAKERAKQNGVYPADGRLASRREMTRLGFGKSDEG
jgi:hypothetical protein